MSDLDFIRVTKQERKDLIAALYKAAGWVRSPAFNDAPLSWHDDYTAQARRQRTLAQRIVKESNGGKAANDNLPAANDNKESA